MSSACGICSTAIYPGGARQPVDGVDGAAPVETPRLGDVSGGCETCVFCSTRGPLDHQRGGRTCGGAYSTVARPLR